jgi:hypothetical protein
MKKMSFLALMLTFTTTMTMGQGILNKVGIKKNSPISTTIISKESESKTPTSQNESKAPVLNNELKISNQNGEYKTLGATSELHKKNMGKIVFAPKAESLYFGKEVEAGLSNNYTFGEEVYTRVYMDNSLSNYIIKAMPTLDKTVVDEKSYYTLHFFLDGVEYYKKATSKGEFSKDEKHEWTSFKGALNSKTLSNAIMRGEFTVFLRTLNEKLSNGKHIVKITVNPTIDNPTPTELPAVAVGEINYTVNPNSIDPNDESFCLKNVKMSIPALEAKVLKAYKEEKGNSQNPKMARIISKDWEIFRNKLTGLILRRTLNIIVISINSENKYVYKNCVIKQEYIGNKFEDNFTMQTDAYENVVNSRCFK